MLKTTMKRALYKALYGGNLTLWERFIARRGIDNKAVSPIVRQTLREIKPQLSYLYPWHPVDRRRLTLLSIVTIAAIVLSGCATVESFNDWRYTHPPIDTIKFIELEVNELQNVCRAVDNNRHRSYYGCADRLYAGSPLGKDTCYIYTNPSPPEWIKEHEMMHCKGFSHPKGY